MAKINKVDWQYAYLEKLKSPKVRRLMGEKGVVIDGSLEHQIEQITSAGFPSWSLYNSTRKYLLGAVSTSLTFGYLSYKGEINELLDTLKSYREDIARDEVVGPAIGRIQFEGTGRNKHIIVNFNYRVGRLGSDLSLTRDQEISNTFKIKKIEDDGYVYWCHPKTRFDFKQMSLILDEATKLGDKSSEVLPYSPCPTQKNKSKHFQSITETNGYFLGLFANGFLDFVCEDVFKADTFEWANGFEFAARIGDEVVRDRSETIRRIRVEGEQLNLDSGRVNEILGQGHAIHDFGATFIYNSTDPKKYSWQMPIEFKFTSRPKGCSIIGGPLLYKAQGEDWQEYPGKDSIEKLLLYSFQMIIRSIHKNPSISLPNVIKNASDVAE